MTKPLLFKLAAIGAAVAAPVTGVAAQAGWVPGSEIAVRPCKFRRTV